MKTKKMVTFIICFLMGLSLIACTQGDEASGGEENPAASFVKIEPAEADDLENAFLLFGRESCVDCQDFYPYLAKASEEENVKIYYIDTESQDANNPEDPITKARVQYLANEYVPTLVYVNNGSTVKSFYMDMYMTYGTELVPNDEETEKNRLNAIKEFLQDPQLNGYEIVDGVFIQPDAEASAQAEAEAEIESFEATIESQSK